MLLSLERFLNSNLVPGGQYLYQLKFQNKECKQETYLILSSLKTGTSTNNLLQTFELKFYQMSAENIR